MKSTTLVSTLAIFAVGVLAQEITIPATNGSLPAAGPNGCADGYYPGSDTITFTVPYSYTQVLSIIGNYTNLTWSGSPDNSVTSNSTDWVPGTARFYDVAGAHVIETITTYDKPPTGGPYIEIHTLAPLTIPSLNMSFYSDYDAQNWTSICDGWATTSNFTIDFCATNVTTAASVLHTLHLQDAMTVGTFLGGMNFSSCAALEAYWKENGSSYAGLNGSATSSGPPAMFTGTGAQLNVGFGSIMMGLVAMAFLTYL